MRKLLLVSVLLISQFSLAADPPKLTEHSRATIELPLFSGWYQGKPVYYISTDMSDQGMAQQMRTNYVPRLANAVRAPMPGQISVVDRVYKFSNFDQGSVFPSAPEPIGQGSKSESYTPLWVVYQVSWLPGQTPHVLRSEEDVLDAVDRHQVSLEPTTIVVNCSIVYSPQDGLLPGAKVHKLK
jgi:hypothetical protein